MSSTVFVNSVTLSDDDWFNDLNRLHYTIFGDPATAAAARTTFLTYSGTYTPTLSAGSNVQASTVRLANYCRIGDMVVVQGLVDIDPTAATTTQWEFDLPVASNLANAWECSGSFVAGLFEAGQISGSAANDTAVFQYTATGTANVSITYMFAYRVI